MIHNKESIVSYVLNKESIVSYVLNKESIVSYVLNKESIVKLTSLVYTEFKSSTSMLLQCGCFV